MHDEIREAFGQIHATEQMKQSVSEYLAQDRTKTARGSIRIGLLRPLVSICALLLICIGIGNWYFWEMPVSYVSVDVNPSIDLTLNRKNRVTDVLSRNKEGEMVLADVQVKGKDYLEAVELLMESETMQAYLTGNAELTVTVASSKAEELLDGFANSPITTYYHGMCKSTDMEIAASAHDCGMSLGKYQMYQLLSQYDSGLTTEACQNIPMCQLHQLLVQYENGRKEAVNAFELEDMQAGCSHNGKKHNGNGLNSNEQNDEQNNTEQNNSEQNNTEQNNGEQNNIEQNNSEQSSDVQDGSGQNSSGHHHHGSGHH